MYSQRWSYIFWNSFSFPEVFLKTFCSCWLKIKDWSSRTPRYLYDLVQFITLVPIAIDSDRFSSFEKRFAVLKNIDSVLSLFKLITNRLSSSQLAKTFTSSASCSMSLSFSLATYKTVSSAYCTWCYLSILKF